MVSTCRLNQQASSSSSSDPLAFPHWLAPGSRNTADYLDKSEPSVAIATIIVSSALHTPQSQSKLCEIHTHSEMLYLEKLAVRLYLVYKISYHMPMLVQVLLKKIFLDNHFKYFLLLPKLLVLGFHSLPMANPRHNHHVKESSSSSEFVGKA